MANYVNLLDIVYPVGSVYITFNSVNPSDSVGGTWEKIEDKFLQSSGTKNTLNSIGGSSVEKQLHLSYAAYWRALVTLDNASGDLSIIGFDSNSAEGMESTMTYSSSPWNHDANACLQNGQTNKSNPILVHRYVTWDNRPSYITCNMYKRTA